MGVNGSFGELRDIDVEESKDRGGREGTDPEPDVASGCLSRPSI